MDHGAGSYRRFLAGDHSALSEIVGQYKDGLILYLNGYVNDLHTAEELTEDTFFRLITKKPRFSGRSTFKSWLYAIGRHVAVDYLRRGAKTAEISLEDLENYLQGAEDLEQSYIKEEGKIALYRALSKLNADYRAVLWLVYLDGFTNQEAAAILKKSDRQIKNLLYRAKQALRSTLEKEDFSHEDL